jgi:hypothetical protein
MTLDDDEPISIEIIDPFEDPFEYGLDRIRQDADRRGVTLPEQFERLEDLATAGVREQAGLGPVLRNLFSTDDWGPPVANSIVPGVLPVLVVSVPDLKDVEASVSCCSKTSTKTSFGIKVFGFNLGADAKLTVADAVKITAQAGVNRMFGLRIRFHVDEYRPRGNPESGQEFRISPVNEEPIRVFLSDVDIPEGTATQRFLVDSTGDHRDGGGIITHTRSLEKGRSAGITLPFRLGGLLGEEKLGVERTDELAVELTATIPGGQVFRGEWLLGPAGVRLSSAPPTRVE